MAACSLRIPADSAQVRVARLVATAAARRCGLTEDDVDDVRLAVGEAVGRAVVRHERAGSAAGVDVRIVDSDRDFVIEVRDSGAADDPGMAMAVIRALVPGTEVTWPPEGGQVLRMSWSRPETG
ncbi:MAG: ATP-binding protein [Micrococcales bacterium]|nr:ATP-binding protein [Micrococcales bacterium]